MRTVTLEILNEKAFNLLKDLELLKLIRFKGNIVNDNTKENLVLKYKGAMQRQSIEEIEKQLNDLRNEWQ